MGMTCVTNKDEEILGILTDGDLRRIISRGTDIHKKLVSEVMSKKAMTIDTHSLASEAALKMEKEKINHLLVVNKKASLSALLEYTIYWKQRSYNLVHFGIHMLKKKLLQLEWMFFDVDGILTDGSLVYDAGGEVSKKFNVLDGYGIKNLIHSGISVGLISSRDHPATRPEPLN